MPISGRERRRDPQVNCAEIRWRGVAAQDVTAGETASNHRGPGVSVTRTTTIKLPASAGTWRRSAAGIVAAVLQAYKGSDEATRKRALREAYPFGERRHWPYKVWLSEIKRQLAGGSATPPDKRQLPLPFEAASSLTCQRCGVLQGLHDDDGCELEAGRGLAMRGEVSGGRLRPAIVTGARP